MNKIILGLVFLFVAPFFLVAQIDTSNGRYFANLFPVDTTKDVVYGSGIDYTGATVSLKMDIYQPSGDILTQRPLIILAHGGSFVGGAKNDQDVKELCVRFARMGYVTVSMDYRLGSSTIDSLGAAKAVIRAMQDMKAAVRFFRKDAATTNTYKIHPNYIFIGGCSAGAVTALHYAFMDKIAEIPYNIDINAMGGLEGKSGNAGYSDKVNAAVNLCGAIGDTSWIQTGDLDFVSVHGRFDATVPYNKGYIKAFNINVLPVYGSGVTAIRTAHVGVVNPLRTFETGHVPFKGTSPSQIAYMDTTVDVVRKFLRPYLKNNSITSVIKNNTSQELQVFPNPASDNINVIFSNTTALKKIELFDITGQLVYTVQTNGSSLKIEKNNLSIGVYLLKIADEQHGISIRRIVFN